MLDADEVRICRDALPALEPAGHTIQVGRVSRGPVSGSVRVEYRAGPVGERDRIRFAVCRFGPDPTAAGRSELVGVETDRGAISGASLFLLKRYYLTTPEGAAADAPPLDSGSLLPEWRPGFAYLAQQALGGLPRTAIYGLLAAAYALVYGLVGRINLAFGEIAAVGAAAAGICVAALSSGSVLAAPSAILAGMTLAMFGGALHSYAAGRAAFGTPRAGTAVAGMIATLGLSLALSEYLRLAGPAVPDWIPPLGAVPIPVAKAGSFVVTITAASLLTSLVGVSTALCLALIMARSRFGRAWQAVSDDPGAAALFGVDGRRLLGLTLLSAGAAAGLAGALVAVQYGALGAAGGFGLGLKALAAAVLGGVGSVGGALAGGVAIGLIETLWSAYLPIESRDIALYAILVCAVVTLPDGVFGGKGAATRDPLREPV